MPSWPDHHEENDLEDEVPIMNIVQWQANILKDPAAKARPLPVLSFPGLQIIGGSVRDLVCDGAIQARCMKAIADRYPTLAAVSNMDLSVEAEAFGAATNYYDQEIPSISGHLVGTLEEAEKLSVPKVGSGRTGECVKAVALARRQINDRPVLAGVIGPFSLAGRLMDMTEIMYAAADKPELVHLVLNKTTRFIMDYIKAVKEAGADGVILAEPAAGLLSPAWNAEFSAYYVRQIVKVAQDDQFLVVYHNCGQVKPLIPEIIKTGARAFHFGNAVNLSEVIPNVPGDRLVLGNVDPARQLAGGTPESVYTAARSLLAQLGGYPNFILSSGCDIPPRAPLANIDAFFLAAARSRLYGKSGMPDIKVAEPAGHSAWPSELP
jgi:uroporphyrinogen decarboxylase